MNAFTASNGIPVTLTDDGRLIVENADGTYPATIAAGEHVDALREFFQHEHPDLTAARARWQHQEDARLGRWRWPENPDYVVYQRDNGSITVLDEANPTATITYWRNVGNATVTSGRYMDAARAYFDAHPEPKPWHDAKPGDVWLLSFAGFETAGSSPWTVRPGRLYTDPPEFVYPQNGNTLALTDPEITSATRIWPEAD